MTALQSSPPARWVHHDAQLARHIEQAEARALRGDWKSGPFGARAREWQAIVAETAYQIAKLQGKATRIVTPQGEESLYIDPRLTGPDVPAPRQLAARRLYRTLELLAAGAETSGDWETWADQAPVETEGLPAVVMVAIVVTAGAAIAYCGHEAAKVIDRELSRKEESARLVQAHATTLDLVDMHTEREDREGRQLPLDAATRAALDALASEQDKIAGKIEPAYGGDLLPTAGPASPWDFKTGALVGLAIGAGLWLVSKTGVT